VLATPFPLTIIPLSQDAAALQGCGLDNDQLMAALRDDGWMDIKLAPTLPALQKRFQHPREYFERLYDGEDFNDLQSEYTDRERSR
jgi:hypothetical protein